MEFNITRENTFASSSTRSVSRLLPENGKAVFYKYSFQILKGVFFILKSFPTHKGEIYKEHMSSLTRSRCEYLLKNNRLVNDWNTVVEQLLIQQQPKVIKRRKRTKKTKKENPTVALLEQKIEDDKEHRKRILEEHEILEGTVNNINVELEAEKEKTRKTLKLAYLLRLEIAKQKTLIAEQQAVIQAAEGKIENVILDSFQSLIFSPTAAIIL